MPFSISSLRRTGAALPQMGVLWPRSRNGRVACAHPTPHRSDLCPRRPQGGRGCRNRARGVFTAAQRTCARGAVCIWEPSSHRPATAGQNRLRIGSTGLVRPRGGVNSDLGPPRRASGRLPGCTALCRDRGSHLHVKPSRRARSARPQAWCPSPSTDRPPR